MFTHSVISNPNKEKSNFSHVAFFILLLIWSFSTNASTFKLIGVTTANELPLTNVLVTVYEGSYPVTRSYTENNGKFVVSLEFNKKFTINLEKEGYASEMIMVNTNLPEMSSDQPTSHEISLKMFALKNEAVSFTFNEPVAIIAFHESVNDFTSDINYKKTFISKDETNLSVHEKLGNAGITQEFKYELTLNRHKTKEETPEVVESEKKVVFTENKKVEVTLVKNEIAFNENSKKEPVSIIIPKKEISNRHETLVEHTREINKTIVELNAKTIEYTIITYNHGGVYYFKNGASISAEAYGRELKNTHR